MDHRPPVSLDQSAEVPASGCETDCAAEDSVERLNRTCFCVTVDPATVRKAVEEQLGASVPTALWETHAHLFATSPVFIDEGHLTAMASVVAAVEHIVATPVFREAALAWAPPIARFDPGPRGGLLGYDFHLSAAGPKLIEINTNPGGAFLNAVLGRAHRSCCRDDQGFSTAPAGIDLEQSLADVLRAEWQLQRGTAPLRSIAIVDDEPQQQYLYPEFLVVKEVLRRHGIEAVVCDPTELVARDDGLFHSDAPIDLVYNRLTDFSLNAPGHEAVRTSYLAGEVVLTPHPRAHALYADKRNLTLLSDGGFLERTGVASDAIATLVGAVPHTELVTQQNRDTLWSGRRDLFFKPATGYGSRAAYRGDKLTKRVWEEIARSPYVAQRIVTPSQRRLGPTDDSVFKVDVRIYAYAGQAVLVAARMYQGQTTNFRTEGGGFAPVLTQAAKVQSLA